MIIGRGDIASVLQDRDDRVYFASGVSNSQEVREPEYDREIGLLHSVDASNHVVYFSSLSVFYGINRYVQHKKEMEGIIKARFRVSTIVRIGNITWGDNPHTIINFMRNKIERGEPVEIQDAERYVIDQEEFLHWVNLIPDWSCEMNITGKRMKIKDIVKEYCL